LAGLERSPPVQLSKLAAVCRIDRFWGKNVRLARSTPSYVAADDSAVSRNLHRRTIQCIRLRRDTRVEHCVVAHRRV